MRTTFKMNLITMFAMMCAIFMSSTAHAALPRASEGGGYGFVSYTQAQRAITFSDSRQWQSTAGEILVCPHEAVIGPHRKCYAKGNEGDSQWATIEQYAAKFVPNAEIAGFQYSFSGSGGLQLLTVYFRKIAR